MGKITSGKVKDWKKDVVSYSKTTFKYVKSDEKI